MVAPAMHAGTRRQPAALGWRDAVVGAALFVGALAYVSRWPYNLGSSDEGIYLYQAKRLLEGDVFFRDIFDIIPPGAHYLMAAAYALFGTTIGTARAVNALAHGAIMIGLYAASRAAGTGIALALVPPLAHLALCYSPWPFASPHWLASALTVAAFVIALRGAWRARRAAAIALGAIIGLLTAVQQQKAALIGMGVNLLALLLARRGPALPLATQLLCVNAGIGIVAFPAFAWLALQSGLYPIYYSLIEHTLVNYRQHHGAEWGSVVALTQAFAAYTLPKLLKYTPIVLVLELVRAGHAWWRIREPDLVPQSLTMIVFGVSAVASILYFPDFIHIAFIAGIYFVIGASLLDGVLDHAPWAGGAKLVAAAAAVTALAFHLERNLTRSQREFPITADTAFGRIAFSDPNQPTLVTTGQRLLAASRSRETFVYPAYPSLYLMTDAKNPTPYQLLLPAYSGQKQVDEVIAILDARRVPLVFAFHAFVPKDDPFMAYVRAHYVPADPHELFWTRRPE